MRRQADLPCFLADTWWFGLTGRLDDDRFRQLVSRRAQQGFTAAQIVVGIPPEVGPAHPSAQSSVGAAWDLHGVPNEAYLRMARTRIEVMNRHGLTAIVYGGWGPQIEWIGVAAMTAWWRRIVETCDDLDVVYCLTGELDLCTSPFSARALFPARSTDDLFGSWLGLGSIRRYAWAVGRRLAPIGLARRRAGWSAVLNDLAGRTDRPVIVHTSAQIDGFGAVNDDGLLAADTIQTGHSRSSEGELWRRLLAIRAAHPDRAVANLEPWYEGITGQFWLEDQVRAMWMSVGAGATALCYGAQGIWNVGDGSFLAHWGTQSFDEAIDLATPAVLGATYRMLVDLGALSWPEGRATVEGNRLVMLRRADAPNRYLEYYPDARDVPANARGQAFDPLTGRFTSTTPRTGQIVLVVS
ncbi:DUF4038 domain-containing protein [Mycolicibacterium sp. 120270]|uniref:apiosidase-like domain-containing protein n=1 Tax=Mycolicibacterium sp. 120270 TaxID=3090600 RepID=UPI00299D5815|nr:DUF4038 domain-containing protein [Mycolicibacterium sp. 120270]MDX1883990.1 DUF4038 domain-containing protein [Mycolicibacterium sp. 120270]